MPDPEAFFEAFTAECTRLGLNMYDLPGLAMGGGAEGERQFLAHMRSLSPGATWHDVMPDLPRHWVPGKPETWTTPYRPFGDFDYQAPPAGPAVLVVWDRDTDRSCLDALVADAKADGFQIHGAGFYREDAPDRWSLDAIVVFKRRVSEKRAFEFWAWLEQRGDVVHRNIVRTGREKYVT